MKLFHIQRDGRAVVWNLIGRRVKEKPKHSDTTGTYSGDPDDKGEVLLMLIQLKMSIDDFGLLYKRSSSGVLVSLSNCLFFII
jgi:hypothetical protein